MASRKPATAKSGSSESQPAARRKNFAPAEKTADTTGSEPTEDAAQIAQEEIERRVEERTAELTRVNEQLRREINACKRREKQQEANTERLQLAIEQTNDAVWDWNVVSGEIVLTPGWATMLGYEPGERNFDLDWWEKSVHPDSVLVFEEAWNAYLDGRKDLYELEYQIRTKSGHWKWIWARGRCVEWDEQRKPLRAVGTHRDITDRKRVEDALRESCRKLQRAEHVSRMGFLDWELKTNVIELSQQVIEMCGLDPEEKWVTPEFISQICHPEDKDYVRENLELAIKDGKPFNIDHRVVRPDGVVLCVQAQAELERDEKGQAVRLLGTVVDITDRWRAEEALRKSEELHRVTLSSISDTVLITDDSGAFSFVCPNVHVIFGYSEDEVAAKHVRELLGEKLFDRDRLPAAGELVNIERTIRDKSGRDHVLLITAKQVAIGRGTVLYTCRDITERKRAEDALAEEKRLRELLLDSLPHPAMLIRRDRTILAANKTAREAGAKIGGLCWQEIGHADYIPEEDKQYLCQHGAPPPDGTRCTFCLADESLDCREPTDNPQVHAFGRIWDTHWVPLDDDVYLHYAIDMTEYIQTETELRQSEILRAEADKLAAAGRMAARVAHEINNPLAGIKSAFQLIKKAVPKDHPRYGYVDQIEKEIDRIATIVRQMISLHRAERETESAISVRQIVQEVISMLDPVRLKNGVSVEIEMEDCPDIVSLPENALRQVLYSLLVNGIEASPRDETVRIQVVAEDGMLRIRIHDRGPGIPQDLRTRVFEPFFTTKSADTTGGLGLGLSIAKGIVEAAGGSLEFKSQPDHGCVFEVVLPIGETDECPDNGSCGSNPDCGR